MLAVALTSATAGCSPTPRRSHRRGLQVWLCPVRTGLDVSIPKDVATDQITRTSIGTLPSKGSVEPDTDKSGSIGYKLKLILPGSGFP